MAEKKKYKIKGKTYQVFLSEKVIEKFEEKFKNSPFNTVSEFIRDLILKNMDKDNVRKDD